MIPLAAAAASDQCHVWRTGASLVMRARIAGRSATEGGAAVIARATSSISSSMGLRNSLLMDITKQGQPLPHLSSGFRHAPLHGALARSDRS